MHVQNLSSIVNNPKRKGLYQKAKDFYNYQTGKKVKYAEMTEKDVEESLIIPKVNPQKDFKHYLRALQECGVEEYLQNHP